MSISRALASATSGLSAASLRASIASNNVANANSPGYVRRDLVVAEQATGGVLSVGISRSQDQVLTSDRRTAEASVNRADAIANAQIQFSRALGDPESGYGLFSRYQAFEQALADLSVTPESASLQNAALSGAQDLAMEFGTLSDLVADQRMDSEAAIANAVETINEALHALHRINGDMIGRDPANEGTARLEDRRQQLIDEISRYMPIKTVDAGNNKINVMTREGVFLLSGSVQELNFTPSGTIVPTDSYQGGALSGITVGDIEITPGSGTRFSVQSGTLAGLFDVRDRSSVEFQSQLDALAVDLVSRFEDAGVDPTLAPGAAGLFTDAGGALDLADTAGLAARLSVNAAVDPAQGGAVWRLRDGLGAATPGAASDAGILNAMMDAVSDKRDGLTGAGIPGQFSLSEAIAEINAQVGETRTRSEAAVASAQARAEILSTAELSITGVDTDQEMQTLLLVEQAYAANARVIQTVSDMMNILLEI